MATSYRATQTIIKRGDEAGLRTALDDGLDPNLSNHNSWSLLMLAAVEGSVPLAELLLERGAEINRRNRHDETALSLAAQKAHVALLQLLLVHGADKTSRPHGTSLSQWLANSPGLTPPQLAEVLALLDL